MKRKTEGDIVLIRNHTIRGNEIDEGLAYLIKPSDIGNDGLTDGYEFWQVEFTDQPGEYFDRVIRVK